MITITLIALGMCGQANAQLKGLFNKSKDKKEYVPILEVEGSTCSNPSNLSMHDKYVGKIVFSDQQLTLENTSEDLFKSSFSLGDPIYARVFTSNSVGNYVLYNSKYGQTKEGATSNMRHSYTIYYYLDGKQILGWEQNNDYNLRDVNSWQRYVLLPNSSESYDLDGEERRETFNSLAPGVHKVKVVIWAGERESLASIKPIAEGEFDLNVGSESKVKIGKKWSDYTNGDMAKDPKVKGKLTELYTEYLKNKYSGYTIKEIQINSDGYGIRKDGNNIPEHRYVIVTAHAIDNKSGKCYALFVNYAQDYAGGGTYSEQYYMLGNGNAGVTELDCE